MLNEQSSGDFSTSHQFPRAAHPGGWTEHRVDLLKSLWFEGLSASQIAGVLGEGVTRNGVIGKVHRLKITKRAKPVQSRSNVPRLPKPRHRDASTGRRNPNARKSTKRRTHAVTPIDNAEGVSIESIRTAPDISLDIGSFYIPEDQRLSLLEVNEHTCKWPIGDPLTPDFYFCGQHSEDGKPYCEFHARRAYHQIEKKRRRA